MGNLTLATFLAAIISSTSMAVAQNSPTPNQILKPDVVLVDHWFFVDSKDNPFKYSHVRSNALLVRSGQCFGARVLYQTLLKRKLKVHIELVVPGDPANFPFHTGTVTISQILHSVTVDEEVDGSVGDFGFEWGIAESDPKGKYKLSFFLETQLVDTYFFEVE